MFHYGGKLAGFIRRNKLN